MIFTSPQQLLLIFMSEQNPHLADVRKINVVRYCFPQRNFLNGAAPSLHAV